MRWSTGRCSRDAGVTPRSSVRLRPTRGSVSPWSAVPQLHLIVVGFLPQAQGAPEPRRWEHQVTDGHHDVEEEDPHEARPQDLAGWCDAVLPLLTFAVDRQDTTSLVTILVLVLTLRALAL